MDVLHHREVIDVTDTHKEIGIAIGETTSTEFLFVADEEVTKWEYISVKSTEKVDGKNVEVEVLGQIHTVCSQSMALREGIDLVSAEKIIQAGLADSKIFAKTRILGFIYEGSVYQPRRAIQPGKKVYIADEKILKEFYSSMEDEGLYIGHLITRDSVPIYIDVNGFRRHLAILAQTGAGKSYTTGVLIEELLKKGATIVVIDPHADYVFMSKKKSGVTVDEVDIFRTLDSIGRYSEGEIGKKVNTYEVKFSDLDTDDIMTICGINKGWVKIETAIENAIKSLPDYYDLDDLIDMLERGKAEKSNKDINPSAALRYVRRLKRLKVFGAATTNVDKFLKPKHLSVLDLSGLDDRVSDYVAYRVLNAIYDRLTSRVYKYPVFLIIEEAHRFIPVQDKTLSRDIIKKIAAEGRKFGVFMTLITQRPSKIDPDALSQCNSQIIMRITNPDDQNAIRKSSERISESLLNDLPGLNVGEAVVVGHLVKTPIMVRIRKRETKEGGGDIDILSLLKDALEEAEIKNKNRTEDIKKEIDGYIRMMEI